jgi:cell wall-associated NlpC family hydrolase
MTRRTGRRYTRATFVAATALTFLPAPAFADSTDATDLSVDAFIHSGQSLETVDVLSGTLLTDAGGGIGGGAEANSVALNTIDPGVDLALAGARAELERRKAEEKRRAEETLRARAQVAADAGANAAAQAVIGPDGCPIAVPPNTMRGGSAAIGVTELCARSVAQAPTPTAAKAIIYAFANLGVPYSRPNRMTAGNFDCSSYVSKAYEAAGVNAISGGWAPTTRELAPYPGYSSVPWLTTVAWENRRPGDLVITPPSRDDGGGHVMMILADGYMIHTARTGDVSHVTVEYPKAKILATRRAK